MAANQEETWGTGDNSGFGLSWWLGTVPGRVLGPEAGGGWLRTHTELCWTCSLVPNTCRGSQQWMERLFPGLQGPQVLLGVPLARWAAAAPGRGLEGCGRQLAAQCTLLCPHRTPGSYGDTWTWLFFPPAATLCPEEPKLQRTEAVFRPPQCPEAAPSLYFDICILQRCEAGCWSQFQAAAGATHGSSTSAPVA